MPDVDGRETLAWQEFGRAARDLAETIAGDGFDPDLILGVARGGLPLAGALGYALAVRDLRTVNVEFYTGPGATLPAPVMLPPAPAPEAFQGKRVLVADDVADSGRTLRFLGSYLRTAVAVRTVVLYEKPQSAARCDYVWRRTGRWVNFPWSCEAPAVQRAGQVLDA